MCSLFTLVGVILGYIYGYYEGKTDLKNKILKDNPDYYLDSKNKILKTWRDL